MSGQDDTMPFKIETIDRLIANLETITSPDFKVAEWPRLEPRMVNGRLVHPMPYPEYHEFVLQTLANVWTSAYIHPYDVLPEDPPGLQSGKDVAGVLVKPGDFESASLDQIRRYFLLCSRGERFCDGHIEGEILNGNFVAALTRLKCLRSQLA